MCDLPLAPRPPQFHSLKCLSQFFDAIERGEKTFEVRWNDRGYAVGDTIALNRIHPEFPAIMDPQLRPLLLTVTYILVGEEWGIKKGYVVIGFKKQNPAY
jgi:hypothetical protein